MDRKLLLTAITFLILEVFILLGDLGIVPWQLFQFDSHNSIQRKKIGEVISIHQNVRRKFEDAILWEGSSSSDDLYSYDSILTLSNSSAKLKLEGDIQLELHENTLVVLQPVDDESNDSSIRLGFNKGNMRSQARKKGLKLITKDWKLEAEKGSDISLRALSGDKLEIEVTKGNVKLENKTDNQQTMELKQGNSFQLSSKNLEDSKKISNELKWNNSELHLREYTFEFKEEIEISWMGNAQRIKLIDSNNNSNFIDIKKDENSKKLELAVGTYYINLITGDSISKTLRVDIWPSTKVLYYSPLPRDRNDSSVENIYSWSEVENASKYKIQFSKDINFKVVNKEFESSKSLNFIKEVPAGPYYWRVVAFDEKGYPYKSKNSYRVYWVVDPLQAPEIIPNTIRKPASEDEELKKQNDKKIDTSWLEKIWNLVFPKVYAQELPPKNKSNFTLNWEKVSGADFYIVEISSTADFTSPVLIQEVQKNQFIWTNFEKKKYYWRVAGGSMDGRMGLFSKIQELDLTNYIFIAPKPIPQKPKIIESPKAVEAVKQEEAKPIIEEKKIETVVEKPKLLSPLPTYWDFKYSMGWNITSGKIKEGPEYNLTGLEPMNMSFEYGHSVNAKRAIVNFSIRSSEWEPKSNLTFQDKLSTQKIYSHWVYCFNDLFCPGVQLYSEPEIEQLSFESVEVNQVLVGGLLIHSPWFTVKNNKWLWETNFGLSYFGDSWYLDIQNDFSFPLYNLGNRKTLFGVKFDYQNVNGPQSLERQRFYLGIIFRFINNN